MAAEPALRAPRSKTELFVAFTWLALQGFGGVLAVAQHELVERLRWLSKEQFVEMLSLSQVLPGPNVINLSLMFGDRHFGWRGALTAVAAMLAAPLLIVLALAALYVQFSSVPQVAGALRGMGAVASGLILATGLKLAPTLKRNPMGLWPCGLDRGRQRTGDRLVALAVGVGGAGARRIGFCLGVASAVDAASPAMSAEWFGLHGLAWSDVLQLAGHFALLSLLAVGGAISLASEMQRYLVVEHGWIDALQFNASIAIAQAAPGPNILFVALLGWSVAGPLGMLATMAGIMVPSSIITFMVGRLRHARRDALAVQAFSVGLAPLTIGLLLATGWVLALPLVAHPVSMLLVPATIVFMLKTQRSPLWMIAAGAVVGALGGA